MKSPRHLVVTVVFLTLNSFTCFAQLDVVELTIVELNEGYDQGLYTSVEVTQAFLDRINGF